MGNVSGKQLQLFVPPGGLYCHFVVNAPGSLHRSSHTLRKSMHFGNWLGFTMFFPSLSYLGRLWKEGKGHHLESLEKFPLL